MAALLAQRVKRFIPVELTLYLPTPDTRLTALPLCASRSLGDRIRHYRLEQGLTQQELANRSGISKALQLSPLKLYPVAKGQGRDYIDYIIPITSLGARIKNLRLKQGLALRELTKRARLSKDCIWRYEKGIAMPNKEILSRIARSLNVSVAELTKEKLERRR